MIQVISKGGPATKWIPPSVYKSQEVGTQVVIVENDQKDLLMVTKEPNVPYFGNKTFITEFWILGFQTLYAIRILIFFLFFIIYIMILAGNLLIIVLVSTSNRLHSPMYVFLSNLSLSEIFFTTSIIPNMLYVIASGGGTMSVVGCFTQFYAFGSLISTECFLLAVMSFDRYLAICIPLRYNSLMDRTLCFQLAFWSWVLGFLLPVITMVFISEIYFCGSNVIDHFLCDLAPLLKLACSDTSKAELEVFVLSFSIIIFPFTFIVLTYISIIRTILLIPSITGRQKAFSTCSSHLTVVSIYYGTLMFMYSAPSINMFPNANKVMSLLYIVVTPLCNPIIYSLRNQEIKGALQRVIIFKHFSY
ncbi:olfactory receptor 6B2-like [Ascaphus truei]|uniref:olfactory receptor 6B2-like n=1 Tax=Ascaphus truei TaxID=8439 RepID=UPI003F5918A9